MKTILILALAITATIACNCSCASVEAEVTRHHATVRLDAQDRSSETSDESSNAAESSSANGVNLDIIPPGPELFPLPQEYMARLNDQDFAIRWSITFLGDNDATPPRWLCFGAYYVPSSGNVWLVGDTVDPEVSYSERTKLPAPQAFFNLVDYIDDHPDLFFNHDEFENGLDSFDRYFIFSAEFMGKNYSIIKCMLPNGMTPPEVEHVMNAIITDLMMVDLPPNHGPVCDLEDVDDIVAEWGDPVPVHFDATGTTDPDYDPLTFAWDFDGDEVFGENPDDGYTGVPNNPTHTYNLSVGVHNLTVSVKVTDPDDAESICETSFTLTVWMNETLVAPGGDEEG